MKKDNKDNNSFFESFKYNYNNLEGFDSLVKLIIFFAFSLIILIFGRVAVQQDREEAEKRKEINQVNQSENIFKRQVEQIIKKEGTIKITKGDYVVMLKNVKESDGIINGFFQDSNKVSKEFRIKENKVYELVFDEEEENEILLSELNLDFIIPSLLVGILEDNEKLEEKDGNTIYYTYNYASDVSYTISLKIESDNVQSINISNDNVIYEITYK
ncbi:MAG: hypothetical protein IJS56_03275 [Bacilli bacterium]|nr:hypothetical protein [Bacilli bacterium]